MSLSTSPDRFPNKSMGTSLSKVLSVLDKNERERLSRLAELIAIPSISTDSAYDADCTKAAEWLAADLASMGFDARTIPAVGKPYVYAEAIRDPALPTVLFYGHYDVQPVDPLELWDTDPFVAKIDEGKIVARGSSDDKGQVMTFVEACRAWFQEDGQLPINVKVIIEGEEESGSISLAPFLEEHSDLLKADVALICDTSMWSSDTPAITMRLRGLVQQEVIISGPSHDLHSGGFGGPVRNPIHVASKIVGELHNDQGVIQVPGFYDGLVDPSEAVLKQWRELDFSGEEFLAEVGMHVPAGESKYSVLEQNWSRPTCDVNGIVGGYIGEGSKTVLPAKASFKISFRLVPGQNPARIFANFQKFVLDRLPADCRAEFFDHGQSAALVVPETLPQVKAAQTALEAEWGKAPVLMGCGGSIPIAEVFQRDLGIEPLLIGFALDDDRIHSPNEKYDLKSFNGGTRSWARILEALAA
ncbi:MAG: dipeptidase [Alphaproteobacteria bacterium]